MLAALVVFVAVAVAYVQALGGPFLWDDRLLILGAPLIGRGAALGEYLRHPFWAATAGPVSASYYRPLVTASFALDHRLHGDNPAGYHLTNLLLHETNALLLFALVRRAKVRPFAAAAAVLVWALQPRLAEAAAWISGRTDLIASACVFASLLVWGQSPSRRVLASLLVGMGLLAKESAMAGALALIALEWLATSDQSGQTRIVLVARRGVALVSVLAVSGVLRWSAVGFHVEGQALGVPGRAVAVLDALGTYAFMLFDAFRPRAIIGRLGAWTPWTIALGAVVLVGSVAAVARYRGGWRASTVIGGVLAVGAIFPVLHVVPIPLRTLAADRFLYLPSAGIVLALAPRLDAWLGASRGAWLAACALVGALGWSASRRVGVWSDEVEFWVRTYLETPSTNSAAATDLVGVFYRAGLSRDALALAEREEDYQDPRKADARFNRALCLERLGRYDEALKLLLALHSRRHQAEDETQIAILELKLGRADSARARLARQAATGYGPAVQLLARLPEFVNARAELERIPETEFLARARLASVLGEEAIAVPAWLRATGGVGVPAETLREALGYLAQTGDRRAIASVARRYLGAFGPLPPDLASIVSVRLDEIDRLLGVRPRLGLDTD